MASDTSPSETLTIEQLQQQMAQMQQLIESLTLQSSQSPNPFISLQSNTTPNSTIQTPTTSGIKVAPPDVFDGTTSKADTFMGQLALYFHGKRIHDDFDRIILALSYMKGGTAGPWSKQKVMEYSKAEKVTATWNEFMMDFQQTFGDPNPASTARHKMSQLRQGNHTADEYVASFKEWKDDTGYNDAALVEKFEQGLNSVLVDKIYTLPQMPATLEEWISWAIKLDRQWRQRETTRKLLGHSYNKLNTSSPKSSRTFENPGATLKPAQIPQSLKQSDVTPMEVDSGWRSVRPLVCFKCRKPGHKAIDCKSTFNVNSMDFDNLKAFMKEEIRKEETEEKDFQSNH